MRRPRTRPFRRSASPRATAKPTAAPRPRARARPRSSLRKRLLSTALASAVALLALPALASAESADVVNADVNLRLAPDASLLVSETLTFDYQGSYHASYRDIPLDSQEQ